MRCEFMDMVRALTQQIFTVVTFSVIVLTLTLFHIVPRFQDLIFKNSQLVLRIAKSFAICY